MGNKGGKDHNHNQKLTTPTKPTNLTEADFTFLTGQTGLGRAEIKSIFDKFMANNPDAKLDRREFVRLYIELRPEPTEILDEISEFVFRVRFVF